MRNADLDKQILTAKKIIEIIELHNIVAKEASVYVIIFRRRWYDVDEELYQAMEGLKAAPAEIQKQVAIEVINFLCAMEE